MNQHGCFGKWTLVKSIFSTMDFLLLLFALVMFYIMAVNVYNSIICLLYTILTNYKLDDL